MRSPPARGSFGEPVPCHQEPSIVLADDGLGELDEEPAMGDAAVVPGFAEHALQIVRPTSLLLARTEPDHVIGGQ